MHSRRTVNRWLGEQDWAAETRKSYRTTLRSFYRWAHITGRLGHDPAALLPPVKLDQPQPRPTPESVLRQALLTAEPRVRCMIILAARHGLRRGEIAVVHTTDLVEDLAGWSLLVHGKGGKQRLVPISIDLARLIQTQPAGWLFSGRTGGHLSPGHVGKLVGRALDMPGWTTHSLRHRFATVSYAGSRDLLAVQTLLGHSSPETTRRYVRLSDDSLRSAMAHAA